MIHVAVFGYGVVGSGVVEVIEKNKQSVNLKAGQELNVKYILDLRDFPGDPYESKVVHDVNVILDDPEIDIICETMGGVKPAYEYTKRALESGKSVCTSNKEVVAKHGPEFLQIARENNCNYRFEASVGGGIPIIRPLNDCLTAEKIESITGILNGTTNYILTKMERVGADFETVLKEAQDLGYAERNPEADVEGHDARRKIAILASLMMGKNVDAEQVFTEGITRITAADFEYAKAADMTIKLLANAKPVSEDKVLAMVTPCMVSKENPLAMVNDVFNGILVTGNMLGDAMFYGKGAGKLATASAVVADVIDCARNMGRTLPCYWEAKDAVVISVDDVERSFFLRVEASAAAAVEAAFPGARKLTVTGRADVAYLTHDVSEKACAEKCEALGAALLSKIRLA